MGCGSAAPLPDIVGSWKRADKDHTRTFNADLTYSETLVDGSTLHREGTYQQSEGAVVVTTTLFTLNGSDLVPLSPLNCALVKNSPSELLLTCTLDGATGPQTAFIKR